MRNYKKILRTQMEQTYIYFWSSGFYFTALSDFYAAGCSDCLSCITSFSRIGVINVVTITTSTIGAKNLSSNMPH